MCRYAIPQRMLAQDVFLSNGNAENADIQDSKGLMSNNSSVLPF